MAVANGTSNASYIIAGAMLILFHGATLLKTENGLKCPFSVFMDTA